MERYIIVTVARNEEAYIEELTKSVICQTVLPDKWIIVDDGSTDRTSAVVTSYLDRCPFIELIFNERHGPRDFSIKAWAINKATAILESSEIAVVGMIDADISLPVDYCERLIREFGRNQNLGVSGGILLDQHDDKLLRKPGLLHEYVAGGTQFWRWSCLKQIGGYLPLACGGEDTVTNQMAGLKGWDVYPVPGLFAIHRRPRGSVGAAPWRRHYREGVRENVIGYHPLFEFFKCVTHVFEKPLLLGSICRAVGFFTSSVRTTGAFVPLQIRRAIRARQLRTLVLLLSTGKRQHWMNWGPEHNEPI